MGRNHRHPECTRRRLESPQRARQSRRTGRETTAPPLSLRHVDEESLATLHPGDVIVLDDSNSLRSKVESVFFAVLACPSCGTLSLITSPQYFGTVPVICASNLCSCRFRIENQARLVYLPAN